GYLTKPATRRDLLRVIDLLAPKTTTSACRILVVEDDSGTADSLDTELRGENVEIHRVTTAKEALEAVKNSPYSCLILDISRPDTDGLEFLQSLREQCGAN